MKPRIFRTGGLLGMLAVAACSRADSPGPSPAPVAASARASTSGAAAATGSEHAPSGASRPVNFALQDASARDLVEALGGMTGNPVYIDPDVQSIVDCAGVSLIVAEPVPGERAIELAADAIRPWGLLMTRTSKGISVAKAKEPPTKTCRPR